MNVIIKKLGVWMLLTAGPFLIYYGFVVGGALANAVMGLVNGPELSLVMNLPRFPEYSVWYYTSLILSLIGASIWLLDIAFRSVMPNKIRTNY